jgi:hypothetical protein
MAIALIAMAIRALVPAGFMVAPDRDRWLVVTLCSGSGSTQTLLNLGAGAHDDGERPANREQDSGVHQAPCVFAAVAHLAAPVGLADVVRPKPIVAPIAIASSHWVAIGRGLAAPPPWATGPPALL